MAMTARRAAVFKYLRYEFEMDGLELEELVDCLIMNLRELRTSIRAAVQANDQEALADHAHGLKGIAGNVGQTELEEAAVVLETAARTQQSDSIASGVEAVEAMLTELGC